MAPSDIKTSRYANHPFKLIPTPIFTQNHQKPYDQYLLAASAMALSHNVFIRGLNTIYLQATHLEASDHKDFIGYCKSWVEILDSHHKMEEASVFPQIEEITGEKGIMEVNVEQHHAFTPGLTLFSAYLNTNTPETFSGHELISLIDQFAPQLIQHLTEEIPTLLSLGRFGGKLPLLDLLNKQATIAANKGVKTQGTSFFLRNLDVEYEGGLWRGWPGIPGPMWWVFNQTVVRWNGSWWRFASCDARGRLRELEFLDDGELNKGA